MNVYVECAITKKHVPREWHRETNWCRATCESLSSHALKHGIEKFWLLYRVSTLDKIESLKVEENWYLKKNRLKFKWNWKQTFLNYIPVSVTRWKPPRRTPQRKYPEKSPTNFQKIVLSLVRNDFSTETFRTLEFFPVS